MKRLVLATVLVGALALAGCSSKSDDSTGDTPTTAKSNVSTTALPASTTKIAKAEFITKADAICKEAATKLSNAPKSNTAADIESFVTAVVASQRKQMAAIKAVGVPDPGNDEWTVIVTDHTKLYDETEQQTSAIAADPTFFIKTDTQIAKDRTALQAKFAAFGFTECGKAT